MSVHRTYGAAVLALMFSMAPGSASADPPDLTGTCWRLDWKPKTSLGPFGDGPDTKDIPTKYRIIKFTYGVAGKKNIIAEWLTPAQRADYTTDTSGPSSEYIERKRYFGEYPGTFRWLDKATPELAEDGACSNYQRDCAYMWLEARPLASKEKRVPEARPENYGSLTYSQKQSVDNRLLRQRFAYSHNRQDRLELDIETDWRGATAIITGRGISSYPPIVHVIYDVTATQLPCEQAVELAKQVPKFPRPAAWRPGSSGGATNPPPKDEDPYDELKRTMRR